MGKGKPCPFVLLNEPMQTKTEQKLTVHLDSSDVSVVQMGSLLSITDDNGDTLYIFLGAQGWEALRESLNQRYSLAADS